MSDLEDIATAANGMPAAGPRPEGRPAPLPSAPISPHPLAGVSERSWTVHDQGRQFGPHTEMEIAMLLASGAIAASALVWREGSPRWIPVTAIVPLPARPAPAYPPGPYQSSSHPSVGGTKIAAGIFGIVLGCLGIHKFILGFVGAGLVMLLVSVLSCGYAAPIMALFGLIEGIMYLCKSDADFYREYVVNKRQWF